MELKKLVVGNHAAHLLELIYDLELAQYIGEKQNETVFQHVQMQSFILSSYYKEGRTVFIKQDYKSFLPSVFITCPSSVDVL